MRLGGPFRARVSWGEPLRMLVRSVLVPARLWVWVIWLTLLLDIRLSISLSAFVDRRWPCFAIGVADGDKRRLARFTTLLWPGSRPVHVPLRLPWGRAVTSF